MSFSSSSNTFYFDSLRRSLPRRSVHCCDDIGLDPIDSLTHEQMKLLQQDPITQNVKQLCFDKQSYKMMLSILYAMHSSRTLHTIRFQLQDEPLHSPITPTSQNKFIQWMKTCLSNNDTLPPRPSYLFNTLVNEVLLHVCFPCLSRIEIVATRFTGALLCQWLTTLPHLKHIVLVNNPSLDSYTLQNILKMCTRLESLSLHDLHLPYKTLFKAISKYAPSSLHSLSLTYCPCKWMFHMFASEELCDDVYAEFIEQQGHRFHHLTIQPACQLRSRSLKAIAHYCTRLTSLDLQYGFTTATNKGMTKYSSCNLYFPSVDDIITIIQQCHSLQSFTIDDGFQGPLDVQLILETIRTCRPHLIFQLGPHTLK